MRGNDSKNEIEGGSGIALEEAQKGDMRKVEIPARYCHEIEESGVKFMEAYGSIIPGCADRYIYAKNIIEGCATKEELTQFIAEMLLMYDALRFKDSPIALELKDK